MSPGKGVQLHEIGVFCFPVKYSSDTVLLQYFIKLTQICLRLEQSVHSITYTKGHQEEQDIIPTIHSRTITEKTPNA